VTAQTIAAAGEYWDRYYNEDFLFGLGTEDILKTLLDVPAAKTWLDLGAGSESLLWSIPLQAGRLIAADADPQRLALLRAYAAAGQPRGAYRTVLELCGRSPAQFPRRCHALAATVAADCLTSKPLPFKAASADLITQFGLLGLAAGATRFLDCWQHAHAVLADGGWCAGANWNATAPQGRVRLTRQLYSHAFTAAGITPLLITRVPIRGDADFDSVWIYLGRKT
jgi:hypothetical protein